MSEEIVTLGKTVEIEKEKMMIPLIGDIRFNIVCTPDNLRELAIGFVVSEGLAPPDRNCVRIEDDVIIIESALLSISEMGHFWNRTLWHDQTALTSSLRPWL